MLTEVYDYLIQLLAIPPASHIRNIVYVPSKLRPLDSILKMTATMNARLSKWSILVAQTQSVCDNAVFISGLKKELSRAVADLGNESDDRELQTHVLNLIRNGDTITPESMRRDRYLSDKALVRQASSKSQKGTSSQPLIAEDNGSTQDAPAPSGDGDSTGEPASKRPRKGSGTQRKGNRSTEKEREKAKESEGTPSQRESGSRDKGTAASSRQTKNSESNDTASSSSAVRPGKKQKVPALPDPAAISVDTNMFPRP